MDPSTDTGAAAWTLACAAMALLMTPGLALFYGGMVRHTDVVGTILRGLAALAVVTLTWVGAGFTVAFAPGGPFAGDLRWLGLSDPSGTAGVAAHLPVTVVAFFQLMPAVLAASVITGGAAGRWRFGPFLAFTVVWPVVVYAPIAHWILAPDGWAARWGALDYAGGTVVHASAGAAALAVAVSLGRRHGWPEHPARPHNLPMVMTGLAMLWFGWLGCVGGAAYRATDLAGTALVNTMVAAAAAPVAWSVTERFRFGKATSLGAASGVVAGLVAVTPAAGFVAPWGAFAIGATAGLTCHLLVGVKSWFRIDDSLDVAAVHLGGALVGSVGVGLLATTSVNPGGAVGLFYGGGYGQLVRQAGSSAAAAAASLLLTLLICGVLHRALGNRVSPRTEATGLDLAEHGEAAYDLTDHEVPAAPDPRADGEDPAGPAAPAQEGSGAR